MKKQKSTWVDYRDLKSKINVLDVIRHFGIELPKNNGDQYYGSCILPGHAGDRSNQNAFSLNAEKNCWRCLTHCGSGNVIDLYLRLSGGDPNNKAAFREAALAMQETFLRDAASVAPTPVQKKPSSAPPPLKPNPVLDLTLTVKSDVPYLTEEKRFPAEFLKELGVGWVSRGSLSGRVAIPIHNRNGQLVAYAGRGLKKADVKMRGRWLLPRNFHKSIELFNQHRVRPLIAEWDGLVVVEGFWSALRLHQAEIPVVALMGCEISDSQIEQLTNLTEKVWLFLDNDEAGKKARDKVTLKLAERVAVRIIHYPDSVTHTQPEDFTTEELQELLPE